MKPFLTLAETKAPNGSRLTLHEHDGEHFLKLNGRQLMSTTATASELQLGQLACARIDRGGAPRILVGGLGFGFTLRRVLELVGQDAIVHVAEVLPEIVVWNREFLRGVNGALLDDARVEVFVMDVFKIIRGAETEPYDVVILDVDNGPIALVQNQNVQLYDRYGFQRIAKAIRPGGCVAFWSASEDRPFAERLSRAGFSVEPHPAKSHDTARRAAHMIYVGIRPDAEV